MEHWRLILFVLAFAACKESEPERAYYITPAEREIDAPEAGIQKRIEVASNCDWTVEATPEWCSARKTAAAGREYLDVEVLPNDYEAPREAILVLAFQGDRYTRTTASLHISQSGMKAQTDDPLAWNPFAVNKLSLAEYDLSEDGVTRSYRISGTQLFVSPSFAKQVFPGNLIDRHTDNRELTDYRDRYTFNPIHIAAFSNRKAYETESLPSYEAAREMAKQIIAEQPVQNLVFNYIGPIRYNSYRHLHLLGRGNLGLSLDELISGSPYTRKEMEKRTGMIYSGCQSLFKIVMDYPEKLIRETIGGEELRELSYINSVSYGKAYLLVIESDDDFTAVKSVVNQIRRGWNLNDEDRKVRDALDVWYICFDQSGAHATRGDYTLIGNGTEQLPPQIIPVNFTTNKLENNSVGEMVIEFDLP